MPRRRRRRRRGRTRESARSAPSSRSCRPGRKRFCDSASFAPSPPQESDASTIGTPAWSRKLENAAATPGRLSASIAARKSFDVPVPYGCALHVAPHARAELVGADPRLEHRDDGAALLVRDAVEGVVDVVFRRDLLADLARGDERVVAHDVRAVDDAVDRDTPAGLPLLDRAVGHPGGEGLVQPHVVPPGERHVVAEPLVRDLVGVDRGLDAPPPDRLLLRRREQRRLRPGDEPRVLHGAEGHGLRNDELVELGERERHAEVGLDPLEQRARRLGGIAGARGLALRDDDADRRLLHPGRAGVDVVERAHAEGDQVRRQGLGLREAHHAAAARARPSPRRSACSRGRSSRRESSASAPRATCTTARRSRERPGGRRSSRAACRRTRRRRPSGGRPPASRSRRSSPCTRRGARARPRRPASRRRNRGSPRLPGPGAPRPAIRRPRPWPSRPRAPSRSATGARSAPRAGSPMSTDPRKVVLSGSTVSATR